MSSTENQDNKSSYQEYLDWTYFSKNALDKSEFQRLGELLQGVDLFIDVGASHGVYTYHADRLLENSTILCFEADPERFGILQQNVAKWSEGSTNSMQCINAAVSDDQDLRENKTIPFYTTGTQISGGLFSVQERSDAYQPIEIPLVRLDDYYVEGAQTFVKIDVEGAELRVLKGAGKFIQAAKTTFFVEISWWGDRGRRTSSMDVLRFAEKSQLRVDRRLKSDYLMKHEPDKAARRKAVRACLPPLLIRYCWNRLVPGPFRRWRERRENRRRLARYGKSMDGKG